MRRLRRTLFREFVPRVLSLGVTVCLIALMIPSGPVDAVPALDPLGDADIAAAVEAELPTNDGVSAHLVDVSVSEGVITLSGTVDSWAEYRAAAENAREAGAAEVRNRLRVRNTRFGFPL